MGAERNTYQLEIELPFPGSKHSANWTSTGWNWHENFEGRIEAPPVPKESLLIKFEIFFLFNFKILPKDVFFDHLFRIDRRR